MAGTGFDLGSKTSAKTMRRGGLRAANLLRAAWDGWLETPATARPPRSTAVAFTTGGPMLRTPDGTVPLAEGGGATLAGRTIDLVFEDGSCLDIAFGVPDGPLDELGAMVETEIGFRSPFDATEAVWFWSAHENKGEGWRVEAAVLLEATVAPALDAVRAAGARIATVRRVTSGSGETIVARPDWIGAPRTRRRVPAALRLPALAAVLLLGSAATLLVQLGMEHRAASDRAAEARAAISAAASDSATERAFAATRDASLQKLLLVGRLAALIPDGTWLEQLNIDDDAVTVTGYGPSAAEVTRLMSGMEMLTDIRYGSPVTRDNSQDLERFRIVATLEDTSP